jgi:opacity protein-like surface antigen
MESRMEGRVEGRMEEQMERHMLADWRLGRGPSTNWLVWLIAAVLMVCAGAAQAQDGWDDEGDEEDYAFSDVGGYLMVSGMAGVEQYENDIGRSSKGEYLDVNPIDAASPGVSIRFGYRSWEYLAFEMQMDILDGVPFTADTETSSNVTVSPILVNTTFNTKVFPLHPVLNDVWDGRIQPYVIGGVGMMGGARMDEIGTKIAVSARGGGGVDFWINNSVSINAEAAYVIAWGNIVGTRYVGTYLGVAWHY